MTDIDIRINGRIDDVLHVARHIACVLYGPDATVRNEPDKIAIGETNDAWMYQRSAHIWRLTLRNGSDDAEARVIDRWSGARVVAVNGKPWRDE